MASTVSQGGRELALRLALRPGQRTFCSWCWPRARVTVSGIVIGTLAALQLTRLLGYLLYEVGPRDPVAFVSAVW